MTVQGHGWDDNVGAPLGRNRIINGSFDLWQRGTSFTGFSNNTYTADRWVILYDGTSATRTISQQAFTPGNPIPGYEPTYYCRFAQSVAGSGGTYNIFSQHIENVRNFAGQTVTVSFWAKADAARNIVVKYSQLFGAGGSAAVYDNALGVSNTVTLTTSWKRYTITGTINSISGKTVSTGTDSSLRIDFNMPLNSTFTIDFWGIQVEAGSVATPFEFEPYETTLRKCQRYFVKMGSSSTYTVFAYGRNDSTTGSSQPITLPVPMRTTPSSITYTGTPCVEGQNVTALTINNYTGTTIMAITASVASGLTAAAPGRLYGNNDVTTSISVNAEL